MQRSLALVLLLIVLIPLAAGHRGGHDELANTTTEQTDASPAPVGHAVAVDRSTAIGAAVLVILTITASLIGIRRYARRRTG